jgi:glutaminyl-tRNA synthetase
MAVLRPLKVIIDNYPEGKVEELEAENNPEDPDAGNRKVPFSRELYIDQEDFCENPPKGYFRLFPGAEVRLKHAYFIKCVDVERNKNTGEIEVLHCTYDPESRGGNSPDGRKVKGTLQWVSAPHELNAEVRLYDRLFTIPDPDDGSEYKEYLNPESAVILSNCKMEPNLAEAKPGDRYQFMRIGYFCADSVDSKPEALVFNRIVGLKDSWAKVVQGK